MALTQDIKIIRYGNPGNSTQPMNFPQAAGTVYRGSVAITRGSIGGWLIAATAPVSTDVVWGLVESAGPGVIDSGSGIVNSGTSGSQTVEVATGSFWLQSGTGADAITEANIGSTCYLINENTVGLTNGSGPNYRPVAGIIEGMGNNLGNIIPIAASGLPGGFLVAVKVGNLAGTTGGPS